MPSEGARMGTISGGVHSWPEAQRAHAHCASERHERVYHTGRASPGVGEELLPTVTAAVSRHRVSCRRTDTGINPSAALCATRSH